MAKKIGDIKPGNQKMERLWDNFYGAYKALRTEFLALEKGGSMEMRLNIRDKSAEESYKRRQAGWKKRKTNKGLSHGK